MGSQKAPSVKTKTVKPDTYQAYNPLESYKMAADFLNRTKTQTNEALASRYQETGTPAELGARNLGYQAKEAATYLSSIPTTDKYIKDIIGEAERYAPIKEYASENLSLAQQQYAQALAKSGEKPKELDDKSIPSWAQSTIQVGMPKTTA
jgi:hypothetical protein